ncbi:MAG TPA: PQQ-binding-like beta-propeller repeat protein [Gemmatimonadaceae bacterium]|jgi:outer membrane protein assembly factor BamB|nr:PQQ-binding-like beta-propeller repeat protein [Gemmatimonadaceae bacterium]
MNYLQQVCALISIFAAAGCGTAPAARSFADSGGRSSSSPESIPPRRVASTHDWTRFGWDAGRSSFSPIETGITAQNASTLRRQQVRLDGTVDASPIYLHGVRAGSATHDVFFVTTTYGKTLAIDADNGNILWRFTPAGYDSWAGSRRITTSTPVSDPDRNFIYAASPDGHIQKLAVADGRVVWSTAITHLAEREKIASPLNYFHGKIIATTGGYIGDAPPYQGHVAILDAASGRLLQVWNSLCSDRQGLIDPASCDESGSAIWGRAGAVIDTTTGDIFVATGDGKWDGRINWGDATIALDSSATRIVDNYTPANTEELDSRDADVGSTSPVLLGGGYVAQGGKDRTIRLLQFGRTRGATPRRGGEAQTVPTPSGSGLFTAPAVMRSGATTWMFAADGGGTAAWTISGGRLEQKWRNKNAGTSPVIAGHLLYVYDPEGGLRIYEPESGQLVTTLDTGNGHWNSPIVIDGRVALPEGDANRHGTSGVLDIWRLP